MSEALPLPPDLSGKAVPVGAATGISTFMAVAVVDGPVLKLPVGEGLATHVLQNYGRHTGFDALEARIKDPRLVCAQRTSMARRITRLRRAAKNTVKQAAHDSEYALLIAARFKVFFLPHFRVSEMVVGSPLGPGRCQCRASLRKQFSSLDSRDDPRDGLFSIPGMRFCVPGT